MKFACFRPATTLATFAIYSVTSRSQKGHHRFKTRRYHGVPMSKSLQGEVVMILYTIVIREIVLVA